MLFAELITKLPYAIIVPLHSLDLRDYNSPKPLDIY